MQYKWEAYCDTNGRSTENISFTQSVWGTKGAAIQIGGVLQYKLEVYCDTFLRSSGGWVSDILLRLGYRKDSRISLIGRGGKAPNPHTFSLTNQRAKNGRLDPSWLDFAFLGRPDFQSRGPRRLILKRGWGF